MAIRSRGVPERPKGNGLNGEKSGSFGTMMTFRRSAVGQRSCATSGKARRGVEKSKATMAIRSRGCARAAKGNGL